MKLRFESDLPHQTAAIEAVCDLFRGQEACRTEFTVTRPRASQLELEQSELGIGNRLQLLDTDLLKNLHEIQLRHGLKPSAGLDTGDLHFTVEMETGTGKTYVYLRTMYELNRRFGFTKFIVVVPSVAIKEGVDKTVEMTKDHFAAMYGNVTFNSFVYDSSKLGQVRNFATSQHLELMIVTVGAINKKDVNNIYKDSEKVGGEKPIDLIRATRPIVIVDEPQSVEGDLEKGSGGKALRDMHPLCTLRYSATHKNPYEMVYRLDAVDAYERKLVKQIEVASATVEGAVNKPYVKFLGLKRGKGKNASLKAELEVSVQKVGRVENATIVVDTANTDLAERTGRPIYADWRVEDFGGAAGEEYLTLSNHDHPLKVGEAIGGVDQGQLDRLMIRETIKHHLDRELRLRPKGIKVLSLFFIDKVADYRTYDASGGQQKGRLATAFEEEYRRLAKLPKYSTLFKEVDLTHDAADVHDGYFAMDKEKRSVDTKEGEKNGADRENSQRAYNLIMRDKERLLDLKTPLKFIFSHSALREGWDNPNVFQICALREISSEQKRRQTIGRGLRLAVDQQGDRTQGFEVNTLTVVANESYEAFARALQSEIEDETGIRFGYVEQHAFANVAVTAANGVQGALGFDRSKALWKALLDAKLVAPDGKVTEALKRALAEDTLKIPAGFEAEAPGIKARLKRLAGRLDIKDASKVREISVKRAVLVGEEFKALWARVRQKTTYRVKFDQAKLLAECTRALKDTEDVEVLRLVLSRALVKINEGGVDTEAKGDSAPVRIDEADIELPDIITELERRTKLTRQSIVRILIDSGRLDQFVRNPQAFIDQASKAINTAKQHAIIEGIKYVRLGDDEVWAQELFDAKELQGYLENTLEVQKSVYSHIRFDSAIEEDFARKLDQNEDVKLFAKLPGWFKVPTPLGGYNPDWAVVVNKDGNERLYFIVETKGSTLFDDLRRSEAAKIKCGQEHFAALADGEKNVEFVVTDSYEKFMSKIAN